MAAVLMAGYVTDGRLNEMGMGVARSTAERAMRLPDAERERFLAAIFGSDHVDLEMVAEIKRQLQILRGVPS